MPESRWAWQYVKMFPLRKMALPYTHADGPCIVMACVVMASVVMAYIAMTSVVMANIAASSIVTALIVIALYSYDLYSCGLHIIRGRDSTSRYSRPGKWRCRTHTRTAAGRLTSGHGRASFSSFISRRMPRANAEGRCRSGRCLKTRLAGTSPTPIRPM